MGESMESLSEAAIVVICMDEFNGYDWSGRLYFRSREEPFAFRGTLELLKALEGFCDRMDYPQESMSSRSFGPAEKNKKEEKGERIQAARKQKQEVVLSKAQIMENRGERATFQLRIQYRQRATWQGQITWIEENKTANFRSTLELLKIIDRTENCGKNQRSETNGWA